MILCPILLRDKKVKKKPEDLKQFILSESMYQWWARCQYEIIVVETRQHRKSSCINQF